MVATAGDILDLLPIFGCFGIEVRAFRVPADVESVAPYLVVQICARTDIDPVQEHVLVLRTLVGKNERRFLGDRSSRRWLSARFMNRRMHVLVCSGKLGDGSTAAWLIRVRLQ